MVTCAVFGCKNTSNKKFSFFTFPKNPHYRAAWLKVCSKNVHALEHARICCLHFRPECFKPRSAAVEYVERMLNKPPRKIKKLYPDAIPTENLFTENNKPNGNSKLDSCTVMDAQSYEQSVRINNNTNKVIENGRLLETINNNPSSAPTDVHLLETNLDEKSSETTSDNTDNGPAEEESSDDKSDVINKMFSSLPECNFISDEKRKNYFHHLHQIKQVINERLEKERKEKIRMSEAIEKLRKERIEQCDMFLLKYLELKKSEAYWRKECYLSRIKQYCAENKLI